MENFKELYEKDYKLMTWRDSVIEQILQQSPRHTYAWRVYEKLFVKGDPEKQGLYFQSLSESLKRMLKEELVFMDTEEKMFQTPEYKACKIAKLEENLPMLPLSFPLAKSAELYRVQVSIAF